MKDGNYDWNGRPIRVADGKVEDYIGGGQWIPSKLGLSEISKPGGDLGHWRDEAEMKRAMAIVDADARDGAKAGQ